MNKFFKSLTIIAASTLLATCSCSVQSGKMTDPGKAEIPTPQQYADQVASELFYADSVAEVKNTLMLAYKDSLTACRHKLDTMRTELGLANYRLNKVRFYLSLCYKKPAQDKFLKYYLTIWTSTADQFVVERWKLENPEVSSQEKFLKGWTNRAVTPKK